MGKARQSRQLPPSTEPSSPTLHPLGLAEGTGDYNPFPDIDFTLGLPVASDEVLGADFEWNQGWDFSLVDQLFSTVTGHVADAGHAAPAFWDR